VTAEGLACKIGLIVSNEFGLKACCAVPGIDENPLTSVTVAGRRFAFAAQID